MRVALVHDWLTGMRGGERVLDALLDVVPHAEIFTLFHLSGSVSPRIEARPIHTTFLQRVPGSARHYRAMLPLFPAAVATLDLSGFDLVLSSSHCVAKGVPVPRGIPHLCYCHTPMRYVWDQQDAYAGKGRASVPVRLAMALSAPTLRRWDVRTAAGVGTFVANSAHVRARIRRCYGRDAVVVHPPVDLHRFRPGRKEDFYLFLGAAAPYKRLDVALRAFDLLGRHLVVAGPGVRDSRDARSVRVGGNVTFVEGLSDPDVAELLGRARALVLPGVEDFGITVVEALASGTPAVALGVGGVLDTVRPAGSASAARRLGHHPLPDGPPTGIFFAESAPEALADAVRRFERHDFEPDLVAASAAPFSRERFVQAMRDEIARVVGTAVPQA